MIKRFLVIALSLVAMLALAGCGGSKDSGAESTQEIKVGATAGPHAEVVEDELHA